MMLYCHTEDALWISAGDVIHASGVSQKLRHLRSLACLEDARRTYGTWSAFTSKWPSTPASIISPSNSSPRLQVALYVM